jgi:hypothetical protein
MQTLADDDLVSRYLFQKSHYAIDTDRKGKFRVKKDAFQPRPSRPDPVTGVRTIPHNDGVSVTSHQGLSGEDLIACGMEAIGLMSEEGRKGKLLYGRAVLKVGDVRAKAKPLDVSLTPQNGGRNHADILNWPSPIQAIADLNELMIELANMAGEPLLYPQPIHYDKVE